MIKKLNGTFIKSIAYFIWFSTVTNSQTVTDYPVTVKLFSDNSALCLFLPLHSVYIDDCFLKNDSFTTQFFLDSFNQLLSQELKKQKVMIMADSIFKIEASISDLINYDSTVKKNVLLLLNKYKCERLLYPVSCSLQQVSIQHEGWRHNRFGSSYERPERTVVTAKITIAGYNAEGEKVIQRQIEGKSKKPFMHNVFRKFSKKDNITIYARSLYGPPGLKALYKGIQKIFTDQPSER